jgi:hypothetical protein
MILTEESMFNLSLERLVADSGAAVFMLDRAGGTRQAKHFDDINSQPQLRTFQHSGDAISAVPILHICVSAYGETSGDLVNIDANSLRTIDAYSS